VFPLSLKLKKIMVKDIVTVKANATVKAATELMNEYEIGCLLVVDDGKPVGILTERDLLKRIIHEGREPEKTEVNDVMSRPLIAAAPKMRGYDAAKLMFEQKIKKLPVVENGRLVGLVTLTDLIRSEEVISLLNGFSTKDAPKRMKKVVNLYFDRAKRFRRRCPLIMKSGFSMGCQEKKCMWWLGDECAVTKLSRQITSMTIEAQT
jgi:CBS domain-containing protein